MFLLHCEKSLFVLAYHQKIPLQGLKIWLLIPEKFSRHPWIFFTFPMSEKSSGPRKETFCIPRCLKILPVPGMRHFTCLHAIKVWPLEEDLAWLQGPGFSGIGILKGPTLGTRKLTRHWECKSSFQGPKKSRRLFRHGHEKKATFIMQQR
jgi:hypothetical protein